MSFPVCEPIEVEAGLEIVDDKAFIVLARQSSVVTIGGGVQVTQNARILIYDSSDRLLNDTIIRKTGLGVLRIYSNCSEDRKDGAPTYPIGGPDENTDARFVIPEGGRLEIKNYAMTYIFPRGYASSADGWKNNHLRSQFCGQSDNFMQSELLFEFSRNGFFKGSTWTHATRITHIFSYEFIGQEDVEATIFDPDTAVAMTEFQREKFSWLIENPNFDGVIV